MDFNNNLEDTRRQSLIDEKEKDVLCKDKIKKAVSEAIYKVFPKDLEKVNNTLEQYNKAIKSNVLTRFDYFDFDHLNKKIKIIEEIDENIKSVAHGVKQLVEDIEFNKNNIKIDVKKWIDMIDERKRKYIDAERILGREIDHVKDKVEEIKKSKNNIFSITNILLVIAISTTGEC